MSSRSAQGLREELAHPVIDNDGHILEITPLLFDFIREIGGDGVLERYLRMTSPARENMFGRKPVLSASERQYGWVGKSSWWSNTTNTFDRATSILPKLYEERLGHLGIDFAVLYPSEGLLANRLVADDEVRAVACRAINTYQAEVYRECGPAVRGVAVIPMQTPTEAIEELDHAVTELGFKVVLLASGASREVPRYRDEHPEVSHLLTRVDAFGIDSEHDYDLVWQRCLDLGVAATFHGSTVGSDGPRSPMSLAFNRLGGGNDTYAMLASAFLLGGVVRRFPQLPFAFQEAGVGWALNLYEKLVGIWAKRSGRFIEAYDPARLDTAALEQLIASHGSPRSVQHGSWARTLVEDLVPPEVLDEFADLGASSLEEVRDLVTGSFFIGCEADETMNARAFTGNVLDATFKITFGSDIGHWDVPDAADVLGEAFELVEDGLMDSDAFREFTFENAVELHTRANPRFFDGTPVEDAVQQHLSGRLAAATSGPDGAGTR